MATLHGCEDIIRLGCPFAGRNPERYKKCRSCNGAGFTELFQVKEHLKRVHPSKCRKCSFVFAGRTIEEHARRHPECKFRPNEDVEYMTETQWKDITKMRRRCRNTTPGEQWRLLFKQLFGNNTAIPPPYLPSLEQYRRIAGSPSPGLLSALETRLLTSGHTVPFLVNENTLRSCLRHVVPALLDLVGEHGYVCGNATLADAAQAQAQTAHPERPSWQTPTEDHDSFHAEAGDIFSLQDMW